jgi:hypothetical protein
MDDWNTLVESTIDAIYVDAATKEVVIEITCAWAVAERKRLVATGVDEFVVTQMRIYNIVDRANQFNAVNFNKNSTEIARRVFVLIRGREPNQEDLEWPVLKDKLARLQGGSLSLLEIEPVYGATITILASGFRLEPMK